MNGSTTAKQICESLTRCADPVRLAHPLLALRCRHAGAAEGGVGGSHAGVFLRGKIKGHRDAK